MSVSIDGRPHILCWRMTLADEVVYTLTAFDGIEIVVRSYGAGDPVVLIHGATIDATYNWVQSGIASAIVDAGYHVVMPDLRGHGASGKPIDAGALSLDAFTSDVRLILDAFDLARTALVGYSLGSMIALETASRDERVSAVVAGGVSLQGTQREPLSPERDAYVAQLAADRDDDVTDPRARQTRAWDRDHGFDPRARAALIRALHTPWEVNVESVQVPTLVVNGDGDPSPDSLVAVLASARGARVKGDHASALGDPAMAALIVDFLDEFTPQANDGVEVAEERNQRRLGG